MFGLERLYVRGSAECTGAAARVAVWSIRQYQQHISPHKGFVCAHRVLHRGESCSESVLRMVQRDGLRLAIAGARVRFGECREAALLLANRRFEERMYEAEQEKKRRLDATPGQPSPCVERAGCLGQTGMFGACVDLAPFGCCLDW